MYRDIDVNAEGEENKIFSFSPPYAAYRFVRLAKIITKASSNVKSFIKRFIVFRVESRWRFVKTSFDWCFSFVNFFFLDVYTRQNWNVYTSAFSTPAGATRVFFFSTVDELIRKSLFLSSKSPKYGRGKVGCFHGNMNFQRRRRRKTSLAAVGKSTFHSRLTLEYTLAYGEMVLLEPSIKIVTPSTRKSIEKIISSPFSAACLLFFSETLIFEGLSKRIFDGISIRRIYPMDEG